MLRVCLFTDTLADVNGVSRFIQNIAAQARGRGLALEVVTSTRLACPEQGNIHNVPPRLARAMPGYPQLEIAWVRRGAMEALADRLRPTVVHVSTPGPVGLAGRRYALRRGLPLVGTYHTDFPAYVEHLFGDAATTWACSRYMAWFYRPFSRVLTRSERYGEALGRLGIDAERVVRLRPGIDTAAFCASHRDESGGVWAGLPGVRAGSIKVLYVGRVSVEKNLPMLAAIWPRVAEGCAARGLDVQLLVVGDGPYRGAMGEALGRQRESVRFLGFRHGVELATIYASSDLFVFPSRTDTLGQAVMEAQAAGLPVVVSDEGGPREVVEEGVTGFVVPAEKPGLWIQTISRLVGDEALRRRMGRAGCVAVQGMSIGRSFEQFWGVHGGSDGATERRRGRDGGGKREGAGSNPSL